MKAAVKKTMQPHEPAKHHANTPAAPASVDEPAILQTNKARQSMHNALIASGGLFVLAVLIAISSYIAFGTNSQSSTGSGGKASIVSGFLPASIAPAVVSITGSGFTPASISVKTGQAVVWTNSDTAPHFVTSDDPKPIGNLPNPRSGQALSPNDSYSYVFEKAGSYSYHDDLSPDFKGTVIVK